MNGILDPSGGWARTAVGFGLDVAARATALFMLAWLAHAALGRRRALARSALWNASMLGLLCLPLAGLASPRLPIVIIPVSRTVFPARMISTDDSEVSAGRTPDEMVAKSHEGVITERPPDNGRRESPASASRPRSPRLKDVAVTATIDGDFRSTRGPTEATAGSWYFTGGVGPVVGLYGGVVGLLVLRLAGSLAAVRRLRNRCSPVEAPAWVERRDRWAAHLGLKSPVELLRSDRVSVPAVVGHVRPAIILPRSLTDEASPGLVDAVLLHELGHVRRGDFGWNLVRKLAQILYWPHPMAWLLGRVVGQVREQACDDLCVNGLGGAPAYRASLVEVASGLVRRPDPALGIAIARAMNLSRRLAWIDQSRGASSCLLRWPSRFSLAASVVILSGLLGTVEPSRSAAKAADTPDSPRPNPARQPKANPDARPHAGEAEALDNVIAVLRAEEEKYRDIEYSLRLTTRKAHPNAPEGPGDDQSQETRRVLIHDRARR